MDEQPLRATSHELTDSVLVEENQRFAGTGGISANNRAQGFVPAFLDTVTGITYISRFADGRPAPLHLLDGLPPAVVTRCTSSGRVGAAKASVVSGFLRGRRFYTRTEAAMALTQA